MMMRFHTELGVGHMYTFGQAAADEGPEGVDEQLDDQDIVSESGEDEHDQGGPLQFNSDGDESSEAGSVDGTDDEDSDPNDMDDEERLAMDEMYG
jgi:hypothetical protein